MAKLILVEDDLVMVGLLKTLFELEGLQVVSFTGAYPDELIEMLRREKADVMLLDVNMHHINGLEFINRIRQEAEFEHLRVVMTSGIDYKEKCLKSGARAFILKPFNPDELLKIINEQIKN